MTAPIETPAFETLALERVDEHVTIVRLNRPDASNALNTQMGRDLVRCFEDVALDPANLRCIVLTGSGDKAFCAGGDLKERRGMTDEQWTPARDLRADGAGADRLPGPDHRRRQWRGLWWRLRDRGLL
ncbi:enoyl-CoA hydratase-related protein [Bradyrhizobium sp. AUGA SZCCT0160]|uniref:enoyl-CoA hydratase-related protein n=1 Tax=Bradyrhizobium sp. AUGA SZCCT0160 TaxID=2807662 RepID=UPI0024C03F36|nr:enoyl-CoA hydratase/isomerase family protein [Bradyrhizobium sp. AUGA SZCCT0160]